MADTVNLVIFEYRIYPRPITDVGPIKNVSIFKICLNISKIFQIAGIGQLIYVYNASFEIGFFKQVANKIGTDKPAPAGNQHVLHGIHLFYPLFRLAFLNQMLAKTGNKLIQVILPVSHDIHIFLL